MSPKLNKQRSLSSSFKLSCAFLPIPMSIPHLISYPSAHHQSSLIIINDRINRQGLLSSLSPTFNNPIFSELSNDIFYLITSLLANNGINKSIITHIIPDQSSKLPYHLQLGRLLQNISQSLPLAADPFIHLTMPLSTSHQHVMSISIPGLL